MERLLDRLFKRRDITGRGNERNDIYLTRWYLWRDIGPHVYIHKIRRSDSDRYMHDHPWSFISLILAGGYIEERPWREPIFWDSDFRRVGRRRVGSIAYRDKTNFHRALLIKGKPAWSLIITWGRDREWGFMTEGGWVSQTQYFAEGWDLRQGANHGIAS